MAGATLTARAGRDLLRAPAPPDRLRPHRRRGQVVSVERLAAGCLLPSFPGHEVPDWVLRRLEGGLGGITLFAYNVGSPAQLAALTARLREAGDVLVGIDEEGGDVTRLEADTGQLVPGEPGARRRRRRRADRGGRGGDCRRARACRRERELRSRRGREHEPAQPRDRRAQLRRRSGARRSPRRSVRARNAAAGCRRLREALPRARGHGRRLAPRPPGRGRRPRGGARCRSAPRSPPASKR